MALIKCRECGAEVSSNAKKCPQCGVPTPDKNTHVVTMVAGTIFFVLVVLLIIKWVNTPT